MDMILSLYLQWLNWNWYSGRKKRIGDDDEEAKEEKEKELEVVEWI